VVFWYVVLGHICSAITKEGKYAIIKMPSGEEQRVAALQL
jgi:ribosomal protein L2